MGGEEEEEQEQEEEEEAKGEGGEETFADNSKGLSSGLLYLSLQILWAAAGG